MFFLSYTPSFTCYTSSRSGLLFAFNVELIQYYDLRSSPGWADDLTPQQPDGLSEYYLPQPIAT